MVLQTFSFFVGILMLLPLASKCDALLLLESAGRSMHFTSPATGVTHDVLVHSEVSAILDWHVIRGVPDLQLRVALLLRSNNAASSETTGPSLVAIDDILVRCLHAPESVNNVDGAVTVTFFTRHTAIQVLYPCRYDDASTSLYMLVADWRDGNLSVSSNEAVFSLGMARRWLLSHDGGGADAQLLYIQSLDGATSAILLEWGYSIGVYIPGISRLRFLQKSNMRDTELVASCFLFSVGVSGLVRHSRLEDTFYFELYRIFPSRQSTELLLETSTTITDLDSNERRYCSLSSRVAFTDCSLILITAPVLQVEIALTATLESPTASASQDMGGWLKCGTTLLKSRAVMADGGLQLLVSPLRRAQFTPATQMEAGNEEEGPTRGRMGRCAFYHSNGTLDCGGVEGHVCPRLCGVSRHCLTLQAWWQPPTGVDRYFCDWMGVGLAEVCTFLFALFTATLAVQVAMRLLRLRRFGASLF
ncbi:hypothetical protein TraAM80_00172 [Trypanosoma rangeli]|uniref:Membrane-associated protein n=1 Tax=Trypanosoma rangeli TaxID=5698 RepID=A0A3R7NVX6_TRYRA|nr:uncharacterized protein TraAM80_00172 [Trypanosoma rangeli]RNF12629.1 hypothetical protein TraAM80_00172 [Trypanosoma rangeli]|eukprot:RNF12629.1 hypothetical protein TraAM80_00172 [Trypanosoma rangeli]